MRLKSFQVEGINSEASFIFDVMQLVHVHDGTVLSSPSSSPSLAHQAHGHTLLVASNDVLHRIVLCNP